MKPLELNNENFEVEVLNREGDILVDFWATWCGPCMMLAPIVEEIAEEHEELTVGKVNVDSDSELAIRYGIDSIPTLILFRNGKPAARSIGFMPKEDLLETLGL